MRQLTLLLAFMYSGINVIAQNVFLKLDESAPIFAHHRNLFWN